MAEKSGPLWDQVNRLCTMEVPLNERLGTLSAFVRQNGSPFAEAYDDLVARLSMARSGASAPDVGDFMPSFALPDGTGRYHSLESFLDKGPAVLSFNRGHWCPFCTIELNAFKSAHKELAAAGGQVVSIMPDKPEYVAKVAEDVEHAFAVLSDEDNGFALEMNLVIWLGERIRDLMGLEPALVRSQGNNSYFVPIPATFVVGADGRIVARKVDPDFRRRMDIEEILAALKRARS
jgi:peroxiredoxin